MPPATDFHDITPLFSATPLFAIIFASYCCFSPFSFNIIFADYAHIDAMRFSPLLRHYFDITFFDIFIADAPPIAFFSFIRHWLHFVIASPLHFLPSRLQPMRAMQSGAQRHVLCSDMRIAASPEDAGIRRHGQRQILMPAFQRHELATPATPGHEA
jgi:hypothetical protein